MSVPVKKARNPAAGGDEEVGMQELGSHGRSARLLIADDHPMVRYMLRVAMAGHPDIEIVGEATTGPETLDACSQLRPNGLVLDLVLPGLHGFEVVRRLRQEQPSIKILVLTGSDERDAELEAVKLGVDGYIEKSSSSEEISDAIEAMVAGTAAEPPKRDRKASGKNKQGVDGARTLTPREREVLLLIAEGMRSREMAARLGVSLSTVESHIASVYSKFQIRNRVEATKRALALGIVRGL